MNVRQLIIPIALLNIKTHSPMTQELQIQPDLNSQVQVQRHRQTLFDKILQQSKKTPVTFSFLAIIWIVFLVCVAIDFTYFFSNGFRFQQATLSQLGANQPFKIRYNFQIYRLVLPIFLHAGAMHIIFNTMALIFLTSLQEKVPRKLFTLVLIIGGIQGNMLFVLFSLILKNSNMAVGFSSAICAGIGMIMADLLMKSLARGNLKMGLYRILFILAYIVIMSLLPGVDIYGHLGGLLSGFLLTLSFISCWDRIEIKRVIMGSRIFLVVYSIALLSIFLI